MTARRFFSFHSFLVGEDRGGAAGGKAPPRLISPEPHDCEGSAVQSSGRGRQQWTWLGGGQKARLAAIFARAIVVALAFALPAAAAETVTAGSVSSGSTNLWPVMIGIKKGFFAAADIKVDLILAQSNASVIQQLAANSIDISISGGLVDPIRAIDKGAPIALVRIETQKPPYALLAKPTITKIPDLKGKIVSVGGPKDITRIFFERMLTASGVAPRDVDLIFAGATTARMAALLIGRRRCRAPDHAL
jgi:ABC-type nitrate/sulfonate/bicarbonate transport system substrate-binding protein